MSSDKLPSESLRAGPGEGGPEEHLAELQRETFRKHREQGPRILRDREPPGGRGLQCMVGVGSKLSRRNISGGW